MSNMKNAFSEESSKNESPCSNNSDCNKFNQMIHTMIDGEVSLADKAFFEKHADDCLHCLEHYGAEKGFVEEIRLKLNRECCPDSLLLSIKNKIKELR